MESISQTPPIEAPTEKPGCLSEVGWFFSGAVLPLASLAFYRKASQKSVGTAIFFFLLFTSMIACLITANITIAMFSASAEIQKVYDSGQIPEITIRGGVAEVNSKEPLILLDGESEQGKRIIVAVDTTGKMTAIDRTRYDQGLLLTRTELHFLNNGDYQAVPLTEINKAFDQDPLIINADTVKQAWGMLSIIVAVIVLIALWLWHVLLRLMIIAVYALVLWGIVSIIRPKTAFDPIITSGLYAIVPAIYISHLLSRSGFSFPFVQSFLLFVFWVIALFASLMDQPFFKAERPLRGWTGLIGVPMLLVFIGDSFKEIPAPYGVAVLWAVFSLTFLALAGVRAFFRYQDSQTSQTPPPPTIQTL